MKHLSLLFAVAVSLSSGSVRADEIYSSRTSRPISSKLLLGASVEVFVNGGSSGLEITSDVAGVIATPIGTSPTGRPLLVAIGLGTTHLEALRDGRVFASATVEVVEPDSIEASYYGYDWQGVPTLDLVAGTVVYVQLHPVHGGVLLEGSSPSFRLVLPGSGLEISPTEGGLVFPIGPGLASGMHETLLRTDDGEYAAVPVRIHPRDTVQVSFEHSGGRRSKTVQILLHADTGERVFGAWAIVEAGTFGIGMRDSYAYRPSDNVETLVSFRIGDSSVTTTIRGTLFSSDTGEGRFSCAASAAHARGSASVVGLFSVLGFLLVARTKRRLRADAPSRRG